MKYFPYKKSLLLLFWGLMGCFSARSQTICDSECNPDKTCAPPEESGGYCPSSIPDAVEGENYNLVLTVVAPKSGTHNNITVHVDYIDVIGIEGLPEGIAWCKSSDRFIWNYPACIHLWGIPVRIGDYPLTIKVKATILGGLFKVDKEDKTLTLRVIKSEYPAVDFTAGQVKAFPHEPVQFTSDEDHSVQQWNWTFEDGIPHTSSNRNPIVRWEKPGLYTVTLEETNGFGVKKMTKYNYIQIVDTSGNISPQATIYVDKISGVVGEEFTFSDNCYSSIEEWISPLDNNIYQIFCPENKQTSDHTYLWTFEGGVPYFSHCSNPVVHWDKPGIYTVSLLVGNGVGVDKFVLEKYITIKNITGLKAYPNPTQDILIVEAKHLKRIDILNINGTLILTESCRTNHHIVKVNHLPAGLYLLRVTYDNDSQESKKIMIE
jgi:PKD repeat protein